MEVESVKPVKLIEIAVVKGTAIESDPTRLVKQYWDYENNLVFELDPICSN